MNFSRCDGTGSSPSRQGPQKNWEEFIPDRLCVFLREHDLLNDVHNNRLLLYLYYHVSHQLHGKPWSNWIRWRARKPRLCRKTNNPIRQNQGSLVMPQSIIFQKKLFPGCSSAIPPALPLPRVLIVIISRVIPEFCLRPEKRESGYQLYFTSSS